MKKKLKFGILPQPDDTTCGPTCLHAVYNYFGNKIKLDKVIREVKSFEDGGTLAVFLGIHALSKGYNATIYTFDIHIFDPTWFTMDRKKMISRLAMQMQVKTDAKIKEICKAYLDFFNLGGNIEFRDLTTTLIKNLLKKSYPILTGLSATYLYRTPREFQVGKKLIYDDVRGDPSGHFVVLCGYDIKDRTALVADPLMPNPISDEQIYNVNLNRLILAIMLGSITFDANLLVITPKTTK
ncbi:MAG: peptidase-C39 like family protein [Desulfobacterales bacterium]|nr:peptidase-C39 like family protein [Desulfobacterales bacterium]